MKRLLLTLLFLTTALCAQDYHTVPSTVVCTDSENFVMLATENGQPKVFTKSRSAALTKPVTISAEYKANANLLFSSGLRVHLEAETALSVWTAEQDVAIEDDKTVRTSGDGIGVILNVKLEKGKAHFLLPTPPNETSVFTLQTDHAEVEVHATSFSVEIAVHGFTKVRCYDGYLLVTTKWGKQERIDVEEVSVHGTDEMNEVVLRQKVETISPYTWPTATLPAFRYDDKSKTFIVLTE